MNQLQLQQTYERELAELYHVDNADTLSLLAEKIVPNAALIARSFYRVMLQNQFSVEFLTSELVETRLKVSMTAWIEGLFKAHNTIDDIRNFLEQQVQVGHVHARIDLPMSLVNFGMRTLKGAITEIIQAEIESPKQADSLVLINAIIDSTTALINESYLIDIVASEGEAQAFRLHVSSQSLAFDFERLRTSLLDWLRQVLSKFHEKTLNEATFPTIRHSDFGLWLTHKGALILTGRPELEVLLTFIGDANEIIDKIKKLDHRGQDLEQFNQLIEDLNAEVTKVIWILGDTAKEMLDIDSGRDALTHLFNRRYISTVLRHETECSIKTGMRYGVLYIDIDYFKNLNDEHGHDNGDLILQQFAYNLSQSVRTGDYVFRYGGEEFLIVLADIKESQLASIAEKVRALIENTAFKLADESLISATVSIGAAIHDRHPDYQRTITNADKALYRAKEKGRNRVEISEA